MLGHWISFDGGCRLDISKTSNKAWAAFGANFKLDSAKCLSQQHKVTLLNRAVQPIIEFSASRWPPTSRNLSVVGNLQHRMMSLITKTARSTDDTPAEFQARKNRHIARVRKVHWKERVKQRSLHWYAHLSRERNYASPASRLLRYKDALFMETMRTLNRPNSVARGSCTRINQHAIQPRWEESVLKAMPSSSPRGALLRRGGTRL